ncbi:hypothetical protein CH63R_11445 [Colletotrichum higginsianum IMI 349063]|uniref:Uncharacterized protein n=1 Tax=Colletotrichum higginsianum (strain IMI 349063) TaxID=759273 RepID=A0A1B7XYB7_COLHI|nr:hypothetical protein CH63R_11445 [Colletotrichum higginsianum IMI 349063]OBR04742.1 hypothetical protein CH63R_11445 [Colletotrichum higginsianum IMI 349063]
MVDGDEAAAAHGIVLMAARHDNLRVGALGDSLVDESGLTQDWLAFLFPPQGAGGDILKKGCKTTAVHDSRPSWWSGYAHAWDTLRGVLVKPGESGRTLYALDGDRFASNLFLERIEERRSREEADVAELGCCPSKHHSEVGARDVSREVVSGRVTDWANPSWMGVNSLPSPSSATAPAPVD